MQDEACKINANIYDKLRIKRIQIWGLGGGIQTVLANINAEQANWRNTILPLSDNQKLAQNTKKTRQAEEVQPRVY